jgi:hypothetical protein
MPDTWLPGAHHDPGKNAGYNWGRSTMQRTIAHFTVGNDSRSGGRNGYFNFLVHKDASRENGCTQYAEVDAQTWHAAGQGNPYGPSVEFERMTTGGYNNEGLANADDLTVNQVAWGQRLIAFMAEWGIPVQLWDGERYASEIMPGGGYDGWVNHHDIDQQRGDGLLRQEWNLMAGAVSPPKPSVDTEGYEEELMLLVAMDRDGMFAKKGHLYLLDALGAVDINPEPASSFTRTPAGIVSMGTLDALIGDRIKRGIALGIIK